MTNIPSTCPPDWYLQDRITHRKNQRLLNEGKTAESLAKEHHSVYAAFTAEFAYRVYNDMERAREAILQRYLEMHDLAEVPESWKSWT